jgi:hypothetical protein
MTRDEILNMPAGREMDELVADKIIHWNHNHEINECEDGFYSYCMICGHEPRFEEIEPGDCDGYPCYSTDISAAWEVIKEMQTKGYWVYLGVLSSYSYCIFTGKQSPKEYRVETGINETPLAICRAALLTVLEETK